MLFVISRGLFYCFFSLSSRACEEAQHISQSPDIDDRDEARDKQAAEVYTELSNWSFGCQLPHACTLALLRCKPHESFEQRAVNPKPSETADLSFEV